MSLSATISRDDLRSWSSEDRARDIAGFAARHAVDCDEDGSLPLEELAALHRGGLLMAPFPIDFGGAGLGIDDPDGLRDVLAIIGRGNLPLGRLYEGHVNAVALAARYGSRENLGLLADEAAAGRPSGVWMAGEPLRLEPAGHGAWVLRGRKIFCSGAGYLRRPIVAAEHEGGSIMVMPLVDARERADTAHWTAHGMRATATGTVDFDGIEVRDAELIGTSGDYLRSPYFRGGAWRVIAVQLGGLEAVLEAYADQLRDSPHGNAPLQLERYGRAEIAYETARLWVETAARRAEGPIADAAAVDAYVDLARNAFESAALEILALAQKSIGLKAFLRPNPLERLIRDLTTYLRQPNLDVSLTSAAAFRLRAERGRP